MGLTFNEVGRMTLTLFNRLYQHYKNDFDYERYLKAKGLTYEQAEIQAEREEEWF